jgi:hypothetical protein
VTVPLDSAATVLCVAKLLKGQQQTEKSEQLTVNLPKPSDILTTSEGMRCSHVTTICPSDSTFLDFMAKIIFGDYHKL